jgi:hypothetical protein
MKNISISLITIFILTNLQAKDLPTKSFIEFGPLLVEHCHCEKKRSLPEKKKVSRISKVLEGESQLAYSETCPLDSQKHKLKNPSLGFPCGAILEFNTNLLTSEPTCEGVSPSTIGIMEGPNGEQQVVGNNFSIKGAKAQPGFMFESNGLGAVEYRRIALSGLYDPSFIYGIKATSGGGLNYHLNNLLEDEFVNPPLIMQNLVESYQPIKSGHWSSSYPESGRVYSDTIYKLCLNGFDPGHIAVTFCEIKDGNGIVYSQEDPEFEIARVSSSIGLNNCL